MSFFPVVFIIHCIHVRSNTIELLLGRKISYVIRIAFCLPIFQCILITIENSQLLLFQKKKKVI